MKLLWLSFYNLCWIVLWPLIAFYFGKLRKRSKKYKNEKVGLYSFFDRFEVSNGSIWIHALSVGEALSAVPLIKLISRHFSRPLYMSLSTESAYKVISSLGLKLNGLFFLPLDAPWLVRRLVSSLRPSVFILVEGDIWPNLIYFLRLYGTKLFLVNGRMSPKSFRGYKLLKIIGFNIFEDFQAVFVSSEKMKSYYGFFIGEDKVFYVGDMKWDAIRERRLSLEELSKLYASVGIDPSVPLWVAGSVHKGEEDIIISTHLKVVKEIPEAILVLVPRKPQELSHFLERCNYYRLPVVKRSSGSKPIKGGVYVVDTLGELMSFYSMARVAFVGGSLIPFGGHNLMEPACYGIPVCSGPYIYNFSDTAEFLMEKRLLRIVYSPEELESFLMENMNKKLLQQPILDFPYSPSSEILAFLKKDYCAFL